MSAEKRALQRFCWWKNVKVFAKEMTNSIKISQNRVARSHAMGSALATPTGTEQSGANKMSLHPVIWNKVLADY